MTSNEAFDEIRQQIAAIKSLLIVILVQEAGHGVSSAAERQSRLSQLQDAALSIADNAKFADPSDADVWREKIKGEINALCNMISF